MEIKNATEKDPIINICGKRTVEYVVECISKFNNHNEKIRIRAFGSNINKGVEIAQILNSRFGTVILQTRLDSILINKINIPYLEILLKMDENKIKRRNERHRETVNYYFDKGFVNYSTYHLAFDWHFNRNGKISITDQFNNQLLTIFRDNSTIKFSVIINIKSLSS